jgi:hypothetical protein
MQFQDFFRLQDVYTDTDLTSNSKKITSPTRPTPGEENSLRSLSSNGKPLSLLNDTFLDFDALKSIEEHFDSPTNSAFKGNYFDSVKIKGKGSESAIPTEVPSGLIRTIVFPYNNDSLNKIKRFP